MYRHEETETLRSHPSPQIKYLTAEHENIFLTRTKTPAAAFYVCFLPLACGPRVSTPNATGNEFLRKLVLSRCTSWTNSSAGADQTTVCPVVRLLVSPGLRALRGLKARPRCNGCHRSVEERKALIRDSRDYSGHDCVNTNACSNKTRKLCFSIPHFVDAARLSYGAPVSMLSK